MPGWGRRKAGLPADVKEEAALLPAPEDEEAAGNFLAAGARQ
jgi:hypothetical protein